MKLLLASLLLVYAVQSLPRFYRPLGDLEENIGDDDDDDGGFDIEDESDDDDSLFENEKSRKSSRNFGVRERHIMHGDNWEKFQVQRKIEEMSEEERSREIKEIVEAVRKGLKETAEQLIKKGDSTGHPRQEKLKQFQKSNVRKISMKLTDSTSPPFNPYKIDDYLTSDDDLHTPEDRFPITDVLDLPIFRENRKPKNQQPKSARRGGYVRKGLFDDIIDIIKKI